MQRRGDSLFFRIAVPIDLRPHIGGREITKSLKTTDRRIATPRALFLASKALLLFTELRAMPTEERDGLRINFSMELDLNELGKPSKLIFSDVRPGDAEEILKITQGFQAIPSNEVTPPTKRSPTKPATPTLGDVIDDFIVKQDARGKAEMLKKHKLVLQTLFLQVMGNKPVGSILQADIESFFELVNKLPKHWQYDVAQGLTIHEVVALPGRVTLGEATFNGTYRASVGKFLKWAKSKYADQGFPPHLTVDEIEYLGDRKEGELQKQRALTEPELKRLFEGPEMQSFADDPAQAHRYWLPHIGLFTGARINEICQLNPQTDIAKDPDSGIWYFWITDATEADERIKKTVKTKESRKTPIHSQLIELGLLDYVERVKSEGAKLLFPADEWRPKKSGRASSYAAEYFSDFLKQIGIHGVMNEQGRAPRGLHALRHTLLTYGYQQGHKLFCISGHVEDLELENKVGAGYIDMELARPLTEKKRLLDSLKYELDFHRPKSTPKGLQAP